MKRVINNNFFFDTLVLMYLYKKGTVETSKIEEMFGDLQTDTQRVNNIVCNRNRTTSYVAVDYIKYDENKQILQITDKGRRIVEKWFKRNRKNMKRK